MKNTNKKGFTIVELVIVISVIAILSAVLIPVFSNLIAQANMSADEVAVANMNIALASAVPYPRTFNEAKVALDNAGFNTKKNIVPMSKGYIFAWGMEEQAILL